MTTQVSGSFKVRKDTYERELVELARALAPRPDFFVEPLYRELYPPDPEGESPRHENLLFVVNGSEEELEEFHRGLARRYLDLTETDLRMRRRLTFDTILLNERPACRLSRIIF